MKNKVIINNISSVPKGEFRFNPESAGNKIKPHSGGGKE